MNQSGAPFAYNITCEGGTISLVKSVVKGDAIFSLRLLANSCLQASSSRTGPKVLVSARGEARISLEKTRISLLELSNKARVVAKNSHLENVTCAGSSRLVLMDSQVDDLTLAGEAKAFLYRTVYIRVLSAGRPVKGAVVEAYFVHNLTLVGRAVTNATGYASLLLVIKILTAYREELYGNYTFRVLYSEHEFTTTVDVSYENLVEFDITPPFPVRFLCLDADGEPVPGVLVKVLREEALVGQATTGDDGVASVELAAGNYSIVAYKLGVEVARLNAALTGPTELVLNCTLYTITVRVIDDTGRTLANALVVLRPTGLENATFTATTDASGRAVFRALPPGDYEVSVRLGDQEAEITIFLSNAPLEEDVVFDLHPPAIRDVEFKPRVTTGEEMTIKAYVEDSYGKVIAVRLCYRVDGGSWLMLNMERVGDHWECVLPAQRQECVVEFYVEAVDEAGNVARSPFLRIQVEKPPLLAGREYVVIAVLVASSMAVAAFSIKQLRAGKAS
ncbi:MAG: hypothetical protein DRJ43_07140 [Thermoprotei archaeon]|nr:MAG: hypothetical protein DRJ43_07140 [Thermoprotei archaeon]